MAFNRRSKNITQGIARSPNRSMYYALGYKEEDFDKPMIGIANGLIPPSRRATRACKSSPMPRSNRSASPQVFGTPTISDGMSMCTEGMKYSLVSHEVIADLKRQCKASGWTAWS